MNDRYGLNFSPFTDAFDAQRFLLGLRTTIELSLTCIVLSVLLGVLGAWLLSTRSRVAQGTVRCYVQAFRNTPPLVQLAFFYFAVGSLLHSASGAQGGAPLVDGYGWAVISFSLLAGAFNGLTQFFRNAPWLVLLFFVMFLLPFELHIGGLAIPLPGWAKSVLGLALPVAANVAELVRGALHSIPESQWSAARGLAFGKLQTIRLVILPQAIRRMLPPWMNLYAILTMATTLISIVGIQDGLTITRAAIASDARPELMLPLYLFLLLLFFAYCYPIARATLMLERRFQVRG